MPMTPRQMGTAIIANLPKHTGRTLDDWIAVVRERNGASPRELAAWLRHKHGLGSVQAAVIVGEATRPADFVPPSPTELLDAQYAGPKAALRPIYERLAAAASALGPDVTLDPRQTYVSLVRQKQFGLIQATSRSRVDLGLVLPRIAPTPRLEAAGSFGSGRTSHRVALATPDDVDDEVHDWLRAAYLANG